MVAERRFTLLTAPSLSCCEGAHIQCRPLVNRNRPILWIGGQIDPKQRNPVARRPECASASPRIQVVQRTIRTVSASVRSSNDGTALEKAGITVGCPALFRL